MFAAMWAPSSFDGGSKEEVRSEADIRKSASVAHIYGKPFVAAESMTSIMNAFTFHPEKLKRTADLELASGLNRLVIQLRDLVKAGAKITGTKSEKSPGMSDDPAEFQRVLGQMYASPNASTQPATEVLQAQGIAEGVTVSQAKAEILHVHRRTAAEDIYWLDNRSADPNDTAETSLILPKTTETELTKIDWPWQVRFSEKRGAPATSYYPGLGSWSEHADPGIRYFSGTATYVNTFKAPEIKKDDRIVLDLGEVKNLAEVIVNGKNLGILWKTPFKTDITDAVKEGANALEIRVTNLWVNRLIGDAQPGVTEKITFTTMPFYQADAPLLPSGLLGPVRILAKR